MTKLDILSGLEEVNIAVAYEIDGSMHEFPPSSIQEMERAIPIYETLSGWNEDISAIRSVESLPQAARNYIKRVGEICDTPVRMVSVGPARDQLVHFG